MIVSIVTPSYNQARFLEAAIQSVLAQDYPRIEYMVVDGGSTDGSLNIIKDYARQLSWWVSEPDRGQSEAINKGLRRAAGEIVAWLNSDDLYLPGVISQVVDVFNDHPDVGLVYADILVIDENGSTINRRRYGDWGLDGLLAFRILGQPSVFLRRSVLDKIGYLDESYHFLMDHQLWLRAARYSDTLYVPLPWAAARSHAEAKNIARGAEMSEEAYRVVEWMQQQADFALLFDKNRRRIWAGAHRFHAHYLLDDGQAARAFRLYWRSLLTHPPTALLEWRRLVYAFLSLLGLGKLRQVYLRWRRSSRWQNESARAE